MINYCQAQPKLQAQLEAELALFPFDPATPTRESLFGSTISTNVSIGGQLRSVETSKPFYSFNRMFYTDKSFDLN